MNWFIKDDDRKRHIYISGKTQYGKSTLMKSLLYKDMRNRDLGICFIDAKGTLVPQMLHWVPEYRKNDVIYLDLKTPIPLDFMSFQPDEIQTLVSDVVSIFKRLDEGWGARMDGLLRFALTSLLKCGPATFMDIYDLFTDEELQRSVSRHPAVANNKVLRNFWKTQATKLFKGDSATAIVVSRMGAFILSDTFQVILGTKNAELNIEKAMDERKIILVQLNGDSDEARLYGSLLVSKIQQATMRRGMKPKPYAPFALYVDEFQDFKSSGFDQILSKGGELGLYLTIANQYFDQLNDTNLESSIINCVSTFFLFRMNPANARQLKDELKDPVLPKPDVNLKELRGELAETKKLIHYWDNHPLMMEMGGPGDTADRIMRKIQDNEDREETLTTQIQAIENIIPPIRFLDQLSTLPVGQCIYRAADGTTLRIDTPLPPPHTSQVGKTSHAKYIRDRTLSKYGPKPDTSAESGQKRSRDNSACNSSPVRQDVKNEHNPRNAGKA